MNISPQMAIDILKMIAVTWITISFYRTEDKLMVLLLKTYLYDINHRRTLYTDIVLSLVVYVISLVFIVTL
jgi:hypothetical protein